MVSTSPSTSARDNFSRAAPRRGNRIKSAAASLRPESGKSMRVRCSLHPSMAAVRFTDLQDPAKHKRFGGVIRQAADTVLSKATGYLGHIDLANRGPLCAICPMGDSRRPRGCLGWLECWIRFAERCLCPKSSYMPPKAAVTSRNRSSCRR